jgi:hypothetical protein
MDHADARQSVRAALGDRVTLRRVFLGLVPVTVLTLPAPIRAARDCCLEDGAPGRDSVSCETAIHVAKQFGSEILDTRREDELCVASLVDAP